MYSENADEFGAQVGVIYRPLHKRLGPTPHHRQRATQELAQDVVDRGIAHADSGRVVSLVQRVWGDDVAGVAADATAARDDHDFGVGDEPLSLLNRISRRVSAQGDFG